MRSEPATGRDRTQSTLSAVGLTAFDEAVYRALLGCRSAKPGELSEELGSSRVRVDRSLERLRALGLVSRLSGRPRRYTAVEPDAALESLVRAGTTELEAVRTTAVQLSSIYHSVQRADGVGGGIEVLNDPHELGRWFVRLQHQVREEMLVIDRPPYALAASNPVEPVSLAQGVRWRAIYAPEALERPGALEEIDELASMGEQGRVLPGLPLKLAVADRRIALLPLTFDLATSGALLVRESALLDALVDLFERYWREAVPLGQVSLDDEVDADERALATLLAGGLTDSAIARNLGWSTRTMRRRTRQLFETLAACNRFQAGVQAMRRGWLPPR